MLTLTIIACTADLSTCRPVRRLESLPPIACLMAMAEAEGDFADEHPLWRVVEWRCGAK